MVTEEKNEWLQSLPTMDELKKVVFSMSPTSAAGPDGMSGKFFQSRWDIICDDLLSNFSLTLITKTLQLYKATSGQFINKDKSQSMIPLNTPSDIVDRVSKITGYNCTNGPITYLGCPLYIGGQRIIYFTSIVSKVISRIRGWQTKVLSYGGRVTLVKSVLQSIPIHLLSAISPTKTTINQIKRLIANFFWGWDTERRKYHYASWDTLSYPYKEGVIGVKKLEDV
ncbi:uncharacterized protein LOC129892924 [Solanum dulcamara]|uniref:uncharacterized protein LOC129892924 n=1 Tax=Solanum dulcamara TaxID=45834 RepID=UPI00248585F4|nr:uncharacterized protein LOC129892924 [Solanum dulcamara]